MLGESPQPGETPRNEADPWSFADPDTAWWRGETDRTPAEPPRRGTAQHQAPPGGTGTLLPPAETTRRRTRAAAEAHAAATRDVADELDTPRRRTPKPPATPAVPGAATEPAIVERDHDQADPHRYDPLRPPAGHAARRAAPTDPARPPTAPEPTRPAAPAHAATSDPAHPVTPTAPAATLRPAHPTTPAGPAHTTTAPAFTAAAGPAYPTAATTGGPAQPTAPTAAGPAHSTAPVSPAPTGGPAHLAAPTSSAPTGGPAHLAAPTSSAHTAGPAHLAAPTSSAHTAGPAHPPTPTSPASTARPAHPTGRTGPAHAADPGSAQPAAGPAADAGVASSPAEARPADAAPDQPGAGEADLPPEGPAAEPDVMVLPEPSPRNRPTVPLDRGPAPGVGRQGGGRTHPTEPLPRPTGVPATDARLERLENSPFWGNDPERAEHSPAERSAHAATRRRSRRAIRRPAGSLVALTLLALVSAFFAWVSAEPFWLAAGHGDHGYATTTQCTGSGVTQRCTGRFTAEDGSFTVNRVTLLGVEPDARAPGSAAPARMVSRDSQRAYLGETSPLLQLRWLLGFVLVLICGYAIAGVTGARRLDTPRARRSAVLASLAGPVLLLAGFLIAAY